MLGTGPIGCTRRSAPPCLTAFLGSIFQTLKPDANWLRGLICEKLVRARHRLLYPHVASGLGSAAVRTVGNVQHSSHRSEADSASDFGMVGAEAARPTLGAKQAFDPGGIFN